VDFTKKCATLKWHFMKKALFVIDVQNCFVNSLTRGLPEKICRYIEENRKNYHLIIFTNFVNDPHSNVYRFLHWKKSMVSPEIDIVPKLQSVLKYGLVVPRSVYSVLKIPRVASLLKKREIEEISLCGVDTDCCILATAYDGFDQGYRINLLENLCLDSSSIELHRAALLIFKRNLLYKEKKRL